MAADRTTYIPIDQRDPATVRALILARTSDPGGTEEDVESQIAQCSKLISKEGWTLTHPQDPAQYTETASGMKQVRRPVLRQVLGMAQQHDIDVIVCVAPARIARKKQQRYYAIQTALNFGAEFRFVRYAANHGKPPDGLQGLLEDLQNDMLDEKEATTITDRLTPGRLARHELGLPHGGRYGPAYGYAEGERRYKTTADGRRGAPKGLLTWVVDEDKAQHVRWLFAQVDERDQAEISLRSLAKELEARAPTASGHGHWSTNQVHDVLCNGKYAGLGRNLRYETYWDKQTDKVTGEVFDAAHTRFRAEDATHPTPSIPTTAIPPIIAADQFTRVQAKLDILKEQNWRGGHRTPDATTHSSLLEHGFIRCAHCNGRMVGYWDDRDKHPYYKCVRSVSIPAHACKKHEIRASAVDALALQLLAQVLTDPEKILQLAEASEQRYQHLNTERELAQAHLAATDQRLAELSADRAKLVTAIGALSAVDGMEDQIAATRVRLQQVDQDRADLEADRRQTDKLDRAVERQSFLRKMFETRHIIINFDTQDFSESDETYLHIGSDLTVDQAAHLLHVPYEQVQEIATITPGGPVFAAQDDGTEVLIDEQDDTVQAEDVIHYLLRHTDRDKLRKLLRDMQVVVLVQRPRSRAEWKLYGNTPVADRVTLQAYGTVAVRIDEAKASALL